MSGGQKGETIMVDKATKVSGDKTPEKVLKTSGVKIPEIQSFLKAGVQFGHQAKKWNPKMKRFIFDKRGTIHIIDLSKTLPLLEKAMTFLANAASKGDVLFVGTKRQASEIVKENATKAGGHYIIHRWPGGMMTNFNLIKKSLKKLNELEREFEHGIEDRTKFEVSQMKKDWVKMNRLYEGIKTLDKLPTAIVVVDCKYEKSAILEARKLGIPIVALLDTNADPDLIDYAIPANDDAIKSVNLIIELLAEAVKKGNGGKGVKHELKDYSKFEVKLIKTDVVADDAVEVESPTEPTQRIRKSTPAQPINTTEKKGKSKGSGKGMLENIQNEAETKKIKVAAKTRAKN